jgi:glycerol uptake facilitator-like aquaporin
VFGPVSACHVNPAVTLGALLARRVSLVEAAGYWVAQFAGGILAALVLWGLFNSSPYYSKSRNGLGTNGILTVSRPGENKAVAGVHLLLHPTEPEPAAGMANTEEPAAR